MSQKDNIDEIEKESLENNQEAEVSQEKADQDKEAAKQPEELLKEELAQEKDKFLRLFAEFENYKKRTNKERMELYKTANQEVMVALLPVLDDFDRAMREIDKSGNEELLQGVGLIQNKFKETLKSKGLEEVEVAQGDSFDAELHEAVTQIPAPSKKLKGKVVDVIEKGFKLGERIIRHPKVVVGN